MFWKFVVGVLLLPTCLGFEIAAASMSQSEKLADTVQNIHKDENYIKFASIPTDEHNDSEPLLQTKYEHDYQISHRYYRHRSCPHHRYYSHGVYHPEYVDYYRRDRHENWHYHPHYYNYHRRDHDSNRYYRHQYHPHNYNYHRRDDHSNRYYRHQNSQYYNDYRRYHDNGYYR